MSPSSKRHCAQWRITTKILNFKKPYALSQTNLAGFARYGLDAKKRHTEKTNGACIKILAPFSF